MAVSLLQIENHFLTPRLIQLDILAALHPLRCVRTYHYNVHLIIIACLLGV